MSEFDLIARYFTWENTSSFDSHGGSVVTSVGDDAAILDVPANKQLVTSIDTLISGVHFPDNTPPDAIAHKALAVNLSDLAAMGATPAWFTLALTLPEIEEEWLSKFSASLKKIATQNNIYLVGGDTTRGPLSISIQVMGFVDKSKALLRSGANAGDKVYVTGTLGDAAAGLQSLLGNLSLPKEDKAHCENHLNYPQARLIETNIIKNFASACIDVSDGLLQDLSHILNASQLGAELMLSKLPLSPALQKIETQQALQFALSGGDDYELLFTIPNNQESVFLQKSEEANINVSCIGVITHQVNTITDENSHELTATGYNHFHGE